MIIMGIDPGIERLGYAFIDISSNSMKPLSYGLISTSPGEKKEIRFVQIYNDLNSLIDRIKPDYASVETLIFAKNVKTAMIISEVRGIITLVLAQRGVPVTEFTPLEIKMSITGYGRSSKNQIQDAVRLILSLSEIPKPDDISDAIAIALCCGNRVKYNEKISGR